MNSDTPARLGVLPAAGMRPLSVRRSVLLDALPSSTPPTARLGPKYPVPFRTASYLGVEECLKTWQLRSRTFATLPAGRIPWSLPFGPWGVGPDDEVILGRYEFRAVVPVVHNIGAATGPAGGFFADKPRVSTPAALEGGD